MAARGAIRPLTVRIARKGGAIQRVFQLAAPIEANGALDAGLDDWITRLDGTADEVAHLLDGDASATIGGTLFHTLFADEDTFATVLRALTGGADPGAQPVRVRVVGADVDLLGLPWRLTAAGGAALAGMGWTFEVTPEAAFGPGAPVAWDRTFVEARGTAHPDRVVAPAPALRNVHLPAAGSGARPRVLVVAPGVYQGVSLHTEPHVRALRARLATLGVGVDDPAAFRVTRTARGVQDALARWAPDVVYAYAELSVSAGVTRMVLAGTTGGAAPVGLTDLAGWMRAAPPALLYLNARFDDPAAWRSALGTLGPLVPALVVGRTRAFPSDAGAEAIDRIAGWLAQGGDPVAALQAGGAGVPAATRILCSAHDRWTGDPARVAGGTAATLRPLEAQRAAVLRHAYTLVRSRTRRVLALIAPAPPVSAAVPPLAGEIDLAGADLAPRLLRVPLTIDPTAPLQALKAGLLEALDVTASIAAALLRIAAGARRPPDQGPERALVWLDWKGPADQTELTPKVLDAWLDLGAEVLSPACPGDVRMISTLTLPAGATSSGRLATWLADRRSRGATPGFDWALLPEAGKLEAGDVRAFVDAALPDACSTELAKEAADLVFQTGGGGVDETAALVARAQATSWASLVRELKGEGAPVAGEEDTAF